MKTLTRFLAALVAVCALATPVAAQTVTIRATDASTGADVQRVGDDTNDALRVTLVSPTTVPVSGTVAFSNSTIAVTGTFWQTTQPVSVASLPLPTGAATAAKQPALGTAGTPSSDVISVQGVVGGTTLPVSGTVAATQSGTWTVQPGNTANTTAWLVTGLGGTFPATQSGTWSTRTQDGSGNAITSATRGSERALTVQVVDGSGTQVTSFGGSSSNAAASATGSAVPASASYEGINVGGTLRGWTGLALGSHYTATVAIVDGSGAQVTSFGGSGGTASNYGSAVPSTGTATGYSDGTNMQIPRVFDGDTGAGTQYVPGVILRASGSGGTTEVGTAAAPLQVSLANTAANATAVKVDGSAVTQPVSISGNQAVNLAQVGGATVATGNGTASGAVRVALPTDGTGVVGLNSGTNLVGYVGRKPTYGSKTTITWTGTSLGSGSARESTVIDWTSTRCADARIRIQSKGQTSGSNYVDWYVYTALGDTTYTDGATGSDAAFTAANRFNSRYLGSQRMNAGTSATQVEFQLSDVFGSMPDKWGLIGINNSGAALSATAGDHVLEYMCVN